MNQKWIQKEGKWSILKLEEKQRTSLEEKAIQEHNLLMANCLNRAKAMVKGLSYEQSYNLIQLAVALYQSEVTHTSFYKQEVLEKKQEEMKQ